MIEKILSEDIRRDYTDILEMPQMPNVPPIKDLMAFEDTLQKLNDTSLIQEELKLLDQSDSLSSSYWQDWCKVLASHRVNKLKERNLSNDLLLSTRFNGYNYFVERTL